MSRLSPVMIFCALVLIKMPRGHSLLSAQGTQELQRRRSQQARRGGVPKAQRDECPQPSLRNDLMTKIIRLSADTKVFHEPQPAAGAVSLSEPKTDQEADYRSVTYAPQSSCGLCPPGHSHAPNFYGRVPLVPTLGVGTSVIDAPRRRRQMPPNLGFSIAAERPDVRSPRGKRGNEDRVIYAAGPRGPTP